LIGGARSIEAIYTRWKTVVFSEAAVDDQLVLHNVIRGNWPMFPDQFSDVLVPDVVRKQFQTS
jgi:hypothetical protein